MRYSNASSTSRSLGRVLEAALVLVLILSVFQTSSAWARRRPVPLMGAERSISNYLEDDSPSSESVGASRSEGDTTKPAAKSEKSDYYLREDSMKTSMREPGRRSSFRVGLGFGVMGTDAVANDFLGLETMVGGRLMSRFAVARRWFLAPSISYFQREDALFGGRGTQHLLEGGLNVQFAMFKWGSWGWLIGLAQKVDMRFSQTAGSRSAARWFYRLGPNLGWNFRLDERVHLVIDGEVSFLLERNTNPFFNTSAGILIGL